jgi:DNA-binding NtrC family response regulator
MNIHHALLLTHDRDFENLLTAALAEVGGTVLITENVGEALEIGCHRAAEFDLAVIDRSDCHAITLLSALRTCHPELPVIVVTSTNRCLCAALAYANGATACIAKPISTSDLRLVLKQFGQSKLELAV